MIGSAVASKWTAVGACVPFFRPHVGMVNIQNHSYAQIAYRILDEMETGIALKDCVDKALETDVVKDSRQCLAVSLKDKSLYAYSGRGCNGVVFQKVGKSCVAAGNSLACPAVIEAMITAFDNGQEDDLARRLIAALKAGQDQGGDSRGQEAAAVKVFNYSYPLQRYYPIDLRIDHHDNAIFELEALYDIYLQNERRIFQ